jgi:hypothetical protein
MDQQAERGSMSRASRKAKRDVAKNIVVTEHIKKGQPLEKVLPLTGYKNTETLSRIKKEVMTAMQTETKTEMQLYREDQLTRIQEKWNEIESDDTMTGAEKHLAWSRWMKLEMDLRGTAAPTKSIHASISANPEHSTEYLLFREACAGLNNDQLHEVYAMAKALPRSWVAPPIEADFPVRLLPEATDDIS